MAECIHLKIAEIMALDYQPLSVVSDVGFTHLLNTIEPRYSIPTVAINILPIMCCLRPRKTRLTELLKDVHFLA